MSEPAPTFVEEITRKKKNKAAAQKKMSSNFRTIAGKMKFSSNTQW